MTALLELEGAQERLLALVGPVSVEEIPLAKAVGRYLACAIRARRTQPRSDLSAMDGFAVAGSGPWSIVGEAAAGRDFGADLAKGEAVHISTGAALPTGADRILILENARVEGDQLTATGAPPPAGRHIRRRGFDFAEGDALLDAGLLLGPAQIALALAAGHETVPVGRRPRLAILDSGDELLVSGPGHLTASNAHMLAALCEGLAARTQVPAPVPDRLDAVRQAIAAADADIVVTTGGASVGAHDLIRPALEAEGYALDFWRVAIRPGKPLLVAHKGDRIVLGLPGNPVSAYVTGLLFLLPLLRAWGGSRNPHPVRVMHSAAHDLPGGGERREFLRGQLIGGKIEIMPKQDSSALSVLAKADVLIERPAGGDKIEAGTPVPCILLGNGGIA